MTEIKTLQKEFASRAELVDYVRSISPFAKGNESNIIGGRRVAEEKLDKIDPINYGASRNYGDGKITRLSPYISQGIIGLNEIKLFSLSKCSNSLQIIKFIQELAWRDFWQRINNNRPEWMWNDIENYKTGFSSSDYSDVMPEDIKFGETEVSAINHFIRELISTGYLHNHARMYLASYIIHFRMIKWQAGAKWFLHHLIDGNLASNNLSWQWVASTFSNKPYIFNLENIDKYFGKLIDTSKGSNKLIDKSYEELTMLLFPNIGGMK